MARGSVADIGYESTLPEEDELELETAQEFQGGPTTEGGNTFRFGVAEQPVTDTGEAVGAPVNSFEAFLGLLGGQAQSPTDTGSALDSSGPSAGIAPSQDATPTSVSQGALGGSVLPSAPSMTSKRRVPFGLRSKLSSGAVDSPDPYTDTSADPDASSLIQAILSRLR